MDVHRRLDVELDGLRDRLLLMGGETETAVQRAMYALIERDSVTAREVLSEDDKIDPAVGVILEAKIGTKMESGGVLCRIYHTSEEHLEEAEQMVEDAFKISSNAPDERQLILEVVS